MAIRLLAAASLFVLTLAACGSPSKEDVLTDEKIRASESAPVLPDVQLSENPEPPPAPPAPVVEPPTLNDLDNAIADNVIEAGVPGTIPPGFQDRWGMVASDCRQGDVVGTGMLVTEDSLLFADSIGHLQSVLGDSPGRFIGLFDYEELGERSEQLAFADNRNVLVRSSGGQRIIYRRCIAARPTG